MYTTAEKAINLAEDLREVAEELEEWQDTTDQLEVENERLQGQVTYVTDELDDVHDNIGYANDELETAMILFRDITERGWMDRLPEAIALVESAMEWIDIAAKTAAEALAA